jgi:hypothetical protein
MVVRVILQQARQIVQVVGLGGAAVGFSRPGQGANPEQTDLKDLGNHLGDLGWTVHGTYLTGN